MKITKGVLILAFYILVVNIIATIILFINCNRSLNEIQRVNQTLIQEIKKVNEVNEVSYEYTR